MRSHLLSGTPAGRPRQSEEVAQAVLWLASDKSSYVYGHTLPVDGGTVLGGHTAHMENVDEPRRTSAVANGRESEGLLS